MTTDRPLAILGGSFDPVHNGHLWLATRVAKNFQATVVLLPNAEPPHRRKPVADWSHRVDMCRLAVAGRRHVGVGEEEAPGAVRYTVDTLARFRRRQGTAPLWWVVGADAFSRLSEWERWRSLFSLAHFVVARRAGKVGAPAAEVARRLRRIRKADLAGGVGGVYYWRCAPPAISSSRIRQQLRENGRSDDLPAAVLAYIGERGLYRAN